MGRAEFGGVPRGGTATLRFLGVYVVRPFLLSCEEVDFARGEKELRTVRFSDSAGDRFGSKEQRRRSESCLEFKQKVFSGQF